jgi:hypothetical protein
MPKITESEYGPGGVVPVGRARLGAGPAGYRPYVMRLHYTILITTALGLAGCVPAVNITVPEVRGRVVDSEHRPMPGATVRITRFPNEHEVAVLTTDERGEFVRPEDAGLFLKFLIHVVPITYVTPRYSLVASHGDSFSAAVSFNGGQVKLLGLGRSRTVNCDELLIQEPPRKPPHDQPLERTGR